MVFHGNDDFFWVTATTSEMDTSIAYKTIPFISVLQSITALAVVFCTQPHLFIKSEFIKSVWDAGLCGIPFLYV